MTLLLSVLAGVLVSAAVYLIFQRDLIRVIVALSILSNAANIAIFTAGGLVRGRPPVITPDADRITGAFANPLSQAMILTAIVIGFGLLAFTVVLTYRVYLEFGTADPDALTAEAEALEQRSQDHGGDLR